MAMPTYAGTGAITRGTSTITPPLPGSIQVNDILVCAVESAGEVASMTNQNGGTWAALPQSPKSVGTAPPTDPATRLTLFWSRYNGTQGNPTISDSGDHTVGVIIAIRGCKINGNPYNGTGGGGTEAVSDTSGSIPGGTTTVPNCLVVGFITGSGDAGANGTAGFSGWTNSDLANLTERGDYQSTTGNGGDLGIVCGELASAGTYGATTVTLATAGYKAMISIPFAGEETATVALNSPANAGTVSDTTPDLTFTGSDSNDDDLEYEVQVDTVNTFNSQVGSTPAYRQTKSSTTTSAAFTSNTLAKSLIIVAYHQQVALTSSAPTDTQGNTYYPIYVDAAKSGSDHASLYYTYGTVQAAANTVTIHLDTGGWAVGLEIQEFSGFGDNDPLDKKAQIQQTVSGTTLTGPATGTLSQADELIVATFNDSFNSGNVPAVGSGYSNLDIGYGGSGFTVAVESKVVSATTAVTPTMTLGNSAGGAGTGWYFVATFKRNDTPVVDKFSVSDTGFVDVTNGADTHPFASTNQITYTVQSALTDNTTYYWRVRGKDPSGGNAYGAWSSTRSFLVQSSVSVNPSAGVQSATFSVQTFTVSAIKNVTVTPGSQDLTASIPSFGVSIGDGATPGSQNLTFDAPAPTVSVVFNLNVNATTPNATFSVQAPTVSTATSVEVQPGAQSATFNLIAPTITAVQNVSVSVNEAAATLSVQDPTPSVNEALPVSEFSLTFSIPAFSVAAIQNVEVSPSVLSATFSADSVGVSIGDGATPAVNELAFSVQAPTVSVVFNNNINAGVQSATFSYQTASVLAEINVTQTPGAQSATFSVQNPTVTASQNIAIDVNPIELTFEFESPGIAIGDGATPANLDLTFSVQSPTVSVVFNNEITPSVLSASFSQQDPTVVGGTDVAVEAGLIDQTISIQNPTVSGIANVSPAVASATFSAEAFNVSIGDGASPAAQELTFSVLSPSITSNSNVNFEATQLDQTVSAPAPGISISDSVTSAVLTAQFIIETPIVSTSSNINNHPNEQAATFSLQNPSVLAVKNVSVAVNEAEASLEPEDVGISVGDGATPASIDLGFSIPAFTVSAIKNVNQHPAVLAATLSAPEAAFSNVTPINVDADVFDLTLELFDPEITNIANVIVYPDVIELGKGYSPYILVDNRLGIHLSGIIYTRG